MAGLDFGLSLGPYDAPQRHCFYDSEEEEGVDESRLETPEKLFTLENSSHLFCKLLVITTSSVADMFITSHVVLDSSSCASVTTKRCLKVLKGKYFNRDGVQANAVTEDATVSKFYSVKDRTGVCVCVHEQTLKEEFCNYWGRKVIELTKPQHVIVLHSLPLHSYFSLEDLEDNVNHQLKCLVTSTWSEDPLTDFLPPSNLVSGETASLITQCQVCGVPAAAAILYVSNMLTPAEQIKCFRPILSHSLLTSSLTLKSVKEADLAIPSLLPKSRQDLNTLYT